VLNAVKFTEEGSITIRTSLSSTGKYIVIRVIDTGPGIPVNFRPNLFKAFSQEDNTRTRKTEGLGLGLLVAKGISRRLGGSLRCVRADTSGPDHGTEFEMRVPIQASEKEYRSGSNSPIPSRDCTNGSNLSVDSDVASLGSQSPRRHSSPDRLGYRPPTYRTNSPLTPPPTTAPRQYRNQRMRRGAKRRRFDPALSRRHPLNFLVAEDNRINRMLLVNMLHKMGYENVFEAHDGQEAVRQMNLPRPADQQVDVVLMDLWMPRMDGYEATEKILNTERVPYTKQPTVLAVTADVTEEALERAWQSGMKGLMTKPYKLLDLEILIQDFCAIV
jgi:CheY-like chemotaxis protein